jgi:hypothetical protein
MMDKQHALTPRFEIGTTVFTPGVGALLKFPSMASVELAPFMNRHRAGDWGDMCEEDKASNEDALKYDGRLMSCYRLYDTTIWIITEADRSTTTVLLPDEY